jgi:ABC-2 type transport system ATP-binding protein
MSPTAAIDLQGLTKEYVLGWKRARLRVLRGVQWRVPHGCVYGLLGPNGCGKSTTLRLILGLLRPTSGRCEVLGGSPDDPSVRRRIGYMPDSPLAFRDLSGWELVRMQATLAGVPRGDCDERARSALERVGAGEWARRRIDRLSTGMRRRVALAQALVHDPDLLVLDEPTAGVDPRGVEDMLALIRRLKRDGKTVVVTSHLLDQVAQVCDRVALMDRGRVVWDGELERLAVENTRRTLVVDALSETEESALRQWLGERGKVLHGVDPCRDLHAKYLAAMRPEEREP